jgi:hypothetical protein
MQELFFTAKYHRDIEWQNGASGSIRHTISPMRAIMQPHLNCGMPTLRIRYPHDLVFACQTTGLKGIYTNNLYGPGRNPAL